MTTTKTPQFNYITYGTKVNAQQVERMLEHVTHQHFDNPEHAGKRRPTPVCIWGLHGIGKTEMVRDFALRKGYHFTYIAPAQFEEMGDLLGMPKISQLTDNAATQFVAPDWVPKQKGPGIFLIDDVNRADDRILRGIMQLLQNYELVSWRFPEGWIIVLTANPDGGDYSVSTMDDAMLTRMMHITMEFDVKTWARWAESAGIDPRGIDFILTYPEVVTGARTTPRSLVQFFQSLETIADLRADLDLVKMLGDGCLDEATTSAFITFVNMDLDKLIAPQDILNAPNFPIMEAQIKALVDGQTKRMDILSVMMTRLTNHLLNMKEDLSDKAFNNLKAFILLGFIPNDLRLAMAQDLVNATNKSLKKLYSIPEVAKLLLAKM
ncbi:AAA domain (dynein-related subfamily) [Chitinophaga eiseniae]|uniref:AAA domain (Dynein-related subfamily) n=1 Tax=Chitinophaga eiseniae TaxID=634771 RepID=A0A1T4MYL7_9BACT|nr:AAA family ATPase [Chitinophaga eiseniae]SJZ72001.1 AAA domain (dynein-related subfamily) [Chitinophaga eiseniae]